SSSMLVTRWPLAIVRSAGCSFALNPRMAAAHWLHRLLTGVAAFRRKEWNKSSSLSSPRKRREWDWGFRSVVPSLLRIEESFGPQTMLIAAQPSTLAFLQACQATRFR